MIVDFKSGSLADDLHHNALFPPAIELAVEALLTWAEVAMVVGDGGHHLPPITYGRI